MSEHGAALQTYSLELVKCLEDLKVRRVEIQQTIDKEEHQKLVLVKSIKEIQDRLSEVDKNLQMHKSLRDSYDSIIKDTDCGFKKILESSATLLNLAQHESAKLENEFDDNSKILLE